MYIVLFLRRVAGYTATVYTQVYTVVQETWTKSFKFAIPTSSKKNLGAHYEEYQ